MRTSTGMTPPMWLLGRVKHYFTNSNNRLLLNQVLSWILSFRYNGGKKKSKCFSETPDYGWCGVRAQGKQEQTIGLSRGGEKYIVKGYHHSAVIHTTFKFLQDIKWNIMRVSFSCFMLSKNVATPFFHIYFPRVPNFFKQFETYFVAQILHGANISINIRQTWHLLAQNWFRVIWKHAA